MSTPAKKTPSEVTSNKTLDVAGSSAQPSEGEVRTDLQEKKDPQAQHSLLALREEVDRLFDNFFTSFSFGPFSRKAFAHDPLHKLENVFSTTDKMVPHTDIVEREKEYYITAELPGMDSSDVDVSIEDGVLHITGEKKSETRKDEDNYHLLERHYGSVMRTFPIPDNADRDGVNARFEKGVLTITIPKLETPEKRAKKIPIEG